MKRIFKTAGIIMITALLLTACTVAVNTEGTEDGKQAVASEKAETLPALENALDQLIESGQMTDTEKRALLDYLKEQTDNSNPIGRAIDAGIITPQQAQALDELLGAEPPEGIPGPNENTGASRGKQDIDTGSITGDLTVALANKIEAQLLADVGYSAAAGGYPIVDTGQTVFYSNTSATSKQNAGDNFFGQDANYTGNQPSYTDNGDGTVTDNVTGLMWQQDPGEKMTWKEAVDNLEGFSLAGYDDWRLPTIKELYSLIQFTGVTSMESAADATPYIDTDYFEFSFGDETGERVIDSQYATSTIYESGTMGGAATMFGVNFADGRIKGYPVIKEFYVMYVRGNTHYGVNSFVDNGDGTITDESTGLMWMEYDSGYFEAGESGDGTMNWQQALKWAENLEFAGYDDWTLPDAKQLQSIVDYTRSPDTTDSAAIDPRFQTTQVAGVDGSLGYAYYWTGTTHLDGRPLGGNAVYIAFGEAPGEMNHSLMDVHGAGAQRSDPKTGNADDYPAVNEHAPQGDVRYVYNMIRLVREAD